MKVGDLVELSAYGKKIMILKDYTGDIGLVLSCHFGSAFIHWTNRGVARQVNRRDIKKIKSVVTGAKSRQTVV